MATTTAARVTRSTASDGYPPIPEPVPPSSPAAMVTELAVLVARIEATRTAELPGASTHCRDCFLRGRDAAIAAILGRR